MSLGFKAPIVDVVYSLVLSNVPVTYNLDIKSLPEGNPGKNILEEMAVMVTTESAKFHRGEYI